MDTETGQTAQQIPAPEVAPEPLRTKSGHWRQGVYQDALAAGLTPETLDDYHRLLVGTQHHGTIKNIELTDHDAPMSARGDGPTKRGWVTLDKRETKTGKVIPRKRLDRIDPLLHATGDEIYGVKYDLHRWARRHRTLDGMKRVRRDTTGPQLILDVDDHDNRGDALERASALCRAAVAKGCRPIVCESPGGGYHLWMWLNEARSVADRVAHGLALLDLAGVDRARVDIRPDLSGNGIRLPLQYGMALFQASETGEIVPVESLSEGSREAVAAGRISAFCSCADRAVLPVDIIRVSRDCVLKTPPSEKAPRRARSKPECIGRKPGEWSSIVEPLHEKLSGAIAKGAARQTDPSQAQEAAPAVSPSVATATLCRDLYLLRGCDRAQAVKRACQADGHDGNASAYRAVLAGQGDGNRRVQPVRIPFEAGTTTVHKLLHGLAYLRILQDAPTWKSITVELPITTIQRVTGAGEHAAREARDLLVSVGVLTLSRCYRKGRHGNIYRFADPTHLETLGPAVATAQLEDTRKGKRCQGARGFLRRIQASSNRPGTRRPSAARHSQRHSARGPAVTRVAEFPLAPSAGYGETYAPYGSDPPKHHKPRTIIDERTLT